MQETFFPVHGTHAVEAGVACQDFERLSHQDVAEGLKALFDSQALLLHHAIFVLFLVQGVVHEDNNSLPTIYVLSWNGLRLIPEVPVYTLKDLEHSGKAVMGGEYALFKLLRCLLLKGSHFQGTSFLRRLFRGAVMVKNCMTKYFLARCAALSDSWELRFYGWPLVKLDWVWVPHLKCVGSEKWLCIVLVGTSLDSARMWTETCSRHWIIWMKIRTFCRYNKQVFQASPWRVISISCEEMAGVTHRPIIQLPQAHVKRCLRFMCSNGYLPVSCCNMMGAKLLGSSKGPVNVFHVLPKVCIFCCDVTWGLIM